jgi:hypothetical protein
MYNVKTPGLPTLVGRKPESFRNCNKWLLWLMGFPCANPYNRPVLSR